MGILTTLVKPFAKQISKKIDKESNQPHKYQQKIFDTIIQKGRKTKFGKEHNFDKIQSYEDYKREVKIQGYEDYKHYVDDIIAGEKDVLWPGKPKYILGTSGTTSGVKYLPLTKDSLPTHFNTARNATFNFTYKHDCLDMFDGKILYLSGSPELTKKGEFLTGRLSGIVNHEVPAWLNKNRLPSYEVNSIPEWEDKIQGILDETLGTNLTMISGIPPWTVNFFEKVLERTGKKTVKEVFPNLNMYVFGGVSIEPYRRRITELMGRDINTIETYPTTEGFVAFQDKKEKEAGLLLNINGGVFFEFIPLDEVFDENPTRLKLDQIELHKPYAIIMTSNAGIYASKLGDVVEFVNDKPYRLIIKGRVQHFISAFGEHVIAEEVETAITNAKKKTGIEIAEFTVAPVVDPQNGELPYHEWYVEIIEDGDREEFARILDEELCKKNFQYADLVNGKIIQPLKLKVVPKGTFIEYFKTRGKLGGQNKVPRLYNSRDVVDGIDSVL